MKVLITICARGGSKGIPGKNIRKLNNKPLIYYTLEVATKFSEHYSTDIQLSTDDDEISEVVRSFGYSTAYKRPAEMASDTAGKIDAIRDAWKYAENYYQKEYDYVLDLDVTSPMRNVDDLLNAFQIIQANPLALNLFSVNTANRNPYFNMVEESDSGFVKLVKGDAKIKSRQEAPKVYDMNASFYFYRRRFFDGTYSTSITDNSMIYVMNHICFDLDHPIDFTLMELLLQNNLLDFSL